MTVLNVFIENISHETDADTFSIIFTTCVFIAGDI